jgi:hypothetical protein
MKIIYKYKILSGDIFKIKMPRDAQILSVQNQLDNLVLWARVETENYDVLRVLHIFFTGSEALPENIVNMRYTATVQMLNGLVVHIFDGGEEPII